MVTSVQYSIEAIKDEARQLISKGLVAREQPIYTLCQYIPARKWVCVECELEKNNLLLRDPIIDLLGREGWEVG
ncbi:DUF4327 family protein [Microcoleus sp. FACHB-53]|jgi:hypothetical protein|nr:DUF4327 family protein [Microcoleus sp. FACHB-53]MBD2126925.1 DUF4327 family protein [Microcoleus sp. FACHB-1]